VGLAGDPGLFRLSGWWRAEPTCLSSSYKESYGLLSFISLIINPIEKHLNKNYVLKLNLYYIVCTDVLLVPG
jgi:hypothetical protein